MKSKQLTALKQPFAAIFFLIFIFSCSKSKDDVNRAPSAFTASVSNATYNSATLNWTAAVDPENEVVTYSIELNGTTVANELSVSTFNLQNLIKNTNYLGKVTAKDASGNSTLATFSFSTTDTPLPSDFSIKMDNATNKSVSVSWTPSTLPGNEQVTYDVFVDNNLKISGITQTNILLNGLTPKTAYKIKIIAKSASGKSTEKMLDVLTADNTAPGSLLAQEVEHGFSFVKLKWAPSTDAENDSLSYFVKINGVVTAFTDAAVNNQYSFIAKNLNAATAYIFTIVAKDPFGAEVSSNTVNVTTNAGPEDNFSFTAKPDGSDVVVEWVQPYTGQFNPAASSFFVNNVEKSLNTVQVNFLDLGNGTMYVKIYLSNSDFPVNMAREIKLKLNWGVNEKTTQSKTLDYTRYSFTVTSARVNYAIIKRYTNGDHGFVLKFENEIISDYSDWTVKEVKFNNSITPGTISLQFPSGKTVQSVFGSLTAAEYDYLKTKSEGYIIVQDSGGFHRLNFNFTAL